VRLSKAWALALGEAGVLTRDESDALQQGLDRVAQRIADGAQPVATDEDIHTMIDRLLHEEAGTVASKLHTGRSRNDQVATASRLWTIDACHRVDAAIAELQQSLLMQAEALTDAVLPAYTHLQRAQPVSGTHWLLAHFWPLSRVSTPASPNASAHALERRTSCGQRRKSVPMERLIASSSGDGPPANRPPHSLWVPASEVLTAYSRQGSKE
jgi:argininosuccinate lyase